MKEVILNVSKENAAKIAECIKGIAEGISAEDIAEIVLKPKGKALKAEEKSGKRTWSSKAIAEFLGRPHSIIFKRLTKYICTEATDDEKDELRLAEFTIPQGQTYPMYELTEEGCRILYNLLCQQANYKTVAANAEKLKAEIPRYFKEKKESDTEKSKIDGRFLLEGESAKEYKGICEMFNEFITGPAMEGREIPELTEKYEEFYRAMKQAELTYKENQQIEDALFEVAIGAEMQGFIYGFKMFDALLNKSLAVA